LWLDFIIARKKRDKMRRGEFIILFIHVRSDLNEEKRAVVLGSR